MIGQKVQKQCIYIRTFVRVIQKNMADMLTNLAAM